MTDTNRSPSNAHSNRRWRVLWNLRSLLWDDYLHDEDFRKGIESTLALFDSHVNGQSLRILDIGCGTGQYAIPLADRGHTVTGMDLSSWMLRKARAKTSGSGRVPVFIEADINRGLDFPRGSFDAVLAIAVLGVAAKPEALLLEIARVLSPGGMLVVRIKDRTKPDGRRRTFRRGCIHFLIQFYRLMARIPSSIKYQNIGTLTSLLRDAGFEIVASAVESRSITVICRTRTSSSSR